MATYSTTAIINYALVLCGATTVSSITDDTPHARALNVVYEMARKKFLTDNKWTFSTTRSTLVTASTSAIAWLHAEEAYAYTRPSAALRIWEFSDRRAICREEGDYIISDSADLGAKYTFDQSDLSKWAPAAIEAFSYKLAADIAFQILNSASKAADLKKYYKETALPDAQSQNSQTGHHQSVIDDGWEAAKFSNGGGDPSRSYS